MLQYPLTQLLIRIEVTITIIYFQKNVRMKANPIHDIFKCLYIINATFR